MAVAAEVGSLMLVAETEGSSFQINSTSVAAAAMRQSLTHSDPEAVGWFLFAEVARCRTNLTCLDYTHSVAAALK